MKHDGFESINKQPRYPKTNCTMTAGINEETHDNTDFDDKTRRGHMQDEETEHQFSPAESSGGSKRGHGRCGTGTRVAAGLGFRSRP